jgi:hypothetical protein
MSREYVKSNQMKKLGVKQMEATEGGLSLAGFACGLGIGIMIVNPFSAFAIGEGTALACAAAAVG